MSKKPKPNPFSLKLSFEERAALEIAANGLPLGTFIKKKAFEGLPIKPPRRKRKPKAHEQELARGMAELARSHIASNLNQIARAANSGSLMLSDELNAALMEACRHIAEIRHKGMRGLGIYERGEQ